MLLATALALLITGCAQQTFTVPKQTGSSTKGLITHHFFVSGIGQKENCRCEKPKFVAAQKMLLKTKTQQTFSQMDYSVYYFRHLYSAGSACVLLTTLIA